MGRRNRIENVDFSVVAWHGLPARETTARMAVLRWHRGSFDLEKQVGASDVAYDCYPGPVERFSGSFEYFFDLGCLAVSDHVY